MAPDLKIEIFAYDIFSKQFMNLGECMPSIGEIYGDECCKSNDNAEECNMFYDAVFYRLLSFKPIYSKELTAEKVRSLRSLSDCYDYVIHMCDRDDLFGHLTVFERMFATSAFVLTLCMKMYFDETRVIDVLRFGHLFWATYFDKFTETFYKEGGWKELMKVSQSYSKLVPNFDFLEISVDYFNVIKESSVNYHRFKKTETFCQHKHITKHWIKFHINNFENYFIVPSKYHLSINAYEGEILFENWKRLCNPQGKNCTEVHKNSLTGGSFQEVKTSGDDNLQIHHFQSDQEVKIGELSKSSTVSKNPIQSECPPNVKAIPFNLIDNNTNSKDIDSTFYGMDLRKANSISFAAHSSNRIPFSVKTASRQYGREIGNFPGSITLDQSSEDITLNNRNNLFQTKNFSSNISEQQIDIPCELVPSQWNQNSQSMCVILPKSSNPTNYKNIADERLPINQVTNDIISINEASSVDQINALEKSENLSSKHLSSKCFNPVNKYTGTICERKNTTKYNYDSGNNDDAVEICDFLRMLLVLGDMQGIKYVLSTLQYTKCSNLSLQKSSTKGKKKPKKKTSKI